VHFLVEHQQIQDGRIVGMDMERQVEQLKLGSEEVLLIPPKKNLTRSA